MKEIQDMTMKELFEFRRQLEKNISDRIKLKNEVIHAPLDESKFHKSLVNGYEKADVVSAVNGMKYEFTNITLTSKKMKDSQIILYIDVLWK